MRVLELYPGEFDDPLRCTMHVCSLEWEYRATAPAILLATGEPIWYTALSYVWGNSAFIRPITCNGKLFKTTHNLDVALRYLRHIDVSIMLWVDQICINQEDLSERTQQVLLMKKIYQRAQSTLVWLGEEADNSSHALSMILDIKSTFAFSTHDSVVEVEDFDHLRLPALSSEKWLYLSRFLSRPWFRRAWIIQEVAVSSNVQLQCGRERISWDDIAIFADCMIRRELRQFLVLADTQADQTSDGCTRIQMIDRTQIGVRGDIDRQASLLTLLVEARGAQATDARDKVFAMTGMASEAINPDYSKPASEIYREAAQMVLSGGTMDWTDLYCCIDHEEPKAGYPSWVPDWSTPRQTTSLGYASRFSGVYGAALYASEDLAQFKMIGDTLSAVGVIFDRVSNIGCLASPFLKDLEDANSATAQFVLESMRMAIEHCQPYPSESGLFTAFWNTLVAGKDHTGKLKAPSDFADIFALLLDTVNGRSPSLPDQPLPKRRLGLENLKVRRPSRTYRQMQVAFEAAVTGRRFGTTSKRHTGLFPRGTRLGDQICVFPGAHIPFVLRPQQTGGGTYRLVGECYVHGIMNDEVRQMTDLKTERIEIT